MGAVLGGWFLNRPGLFLLAATALHLLLWTALPALTFHTLPLDVIENVAWGREWQIGYFKHPPLQAWLAEAALQLSGGRIWSLYLLGPLAIALTLLSIWLLGRELVGPRGALLAALLFSLLYYCTVPVTEFNANIVQMPLWAAAGLLLWRGLTRQGLGWWLGLGVVLALAVYAKYSAAILAVVLAIGALLLPEGWRALRSRGPYLGALVCLALLTPHLWWLWSVDMLPLHYAGERTAVTDQAGLVARTVRFAGNQALMHAGMIALLAIGGALTFWRPRPADAVGFSAERPGARRFVLWLAFGPLLVTMALALAAGLQLSGMWGAPYFAYTGLAAVILLPTAFRQERLGRMLMVWLALFTLVPVGFAATVALAPHVGAKPKRAHYPGPEMAARLTEIWREHTGTPLRLVAGGSWQAGVVATYSADAPSVLTHGSFEYSPWVSPADVARHGVLAVWPLGRGGDDASPEPLAALGPFAAQGELDIPYPAGRHVLRLGWGVVAPATAPQPGS